MIENFCGGHDQKFVWSIQYLCWWDSKLTVFEEWTNGINWFYAWWYSFTKIKSLSKFFWLDMAKNGCGQSCHGKLELAIPQSWSDGINWFFVFWYMFRKEKSWFNVFLGGHGQKWPWPVSSWDPKIYVS